MRRFTDVVQKVSARETWSIECLGIEHELNVRYKMLIEAANETKAVDPLLITMTHVSALRKLENLEKEFFDQGANDDVLWLSTVGGWISPDQAESRKIIKRVRENLLQIYIEVREKLDRPPEHWAAFIETIHTRVDNDLERLFSIRDAEEVTWFEVIADIADAGRTIKLRVSHMAMSVPLN